MNKVYADNQMQNEKGALKMLARESRIIKHLKSFIHQDEIILEYQKIKGKGILPHYYVETTGGAMTIPLKWRKGVKR